MSLFSNQLEQIVHGPFIQIILDHSASAYNRKQEYSKLQRKPDRDRFHTKLSRSDLQLLRDYGFKPRTIGSARLNAKKIDSFGMRQLDRLKMLLKRNENLRGGYPEKIRAGIKRNDPRSFAKGLALLMKPGDEAHR